MDNLINKKITDTSTNNLKNKFKKKLKSKNVNLNQKLKPVQINELLKIKFKQGDENTLILDESVKYEEQEKIDKEKELQKSFLDFLTNKLYKHTITVLKSINSFKDKVITVPSKLEKLNRINSSSKLKTNDKIILNDFINNLIKSEKINFSLFYYGHTDDIFNEVYECFIKLPKNEYITKNIVNKYVKDDKKPELLSKISLKTYEIERSQFEESMNDDKIKEYYNDKLNNPKEFTKPKEIQKSLNEHYTNIIKLLYPNINNLGHYYTDDLCYNMNFFEILYCLSKINKDSRTTFIDRFKLDIETHFTTTFEKIFNYYLHFLNFNYVDNTVKNKIEINSDKIKTKTIDAIKKYLEFIKSILMNKLDELNNSQDNKILRNSNEEIKNDIKTKFENKIKSDGGYISGFLLSTLYDYNKNKNFNINNSFILNSTKRNMKSFKNESINPDSSIDNEYINDYKIYFYNNKTHYFNNERLSKLLGDRFDKELNNSKNKFRIILTQTSLNNLNNIFIQVNEIFIKFIQKNINNYDKLQENYLKVLNQIIEFDKKYYYIEKDTQIKNDIKNYLKSNNLQTNTEIILNSKLEFSKIIFDLNKNIKRIINLKDLSSDTYDKYNKYISEYSLWVMNIINHMSMYPNTSKQLHHFNTIIKMFLNEEDIKKWYNNCLKNNLHYWLPIFHSGKQNLSFFLNLITNEKSYKIKANDLVIIKYDNSDTLDSKIFSWNNNFYNIIEDDSYNRILIFIHKYVKCKTNMNIDDFNVIKELVSMCNISSDTLNLVNKKEYQCKNLISYQQIIKEIIKNKYPFSISNNIDLTNKVKQFKNELYNEIPKI